RGERLAQWLRQLLRKQHAERRVQLVDVAQRGDARVVLRHARAVAEAGLALVAGARGDLGEAMTHQLFFTSLSISPLASRVRTRSPGRTVDASRTTHPRAVVVML